MARPRKAVVEGQSYAAIMQGSEEERRADPVPGNNGEALARIVAFFQSEHPDDWEALRLCPLQHGIQDMVERLK